MRFVGFACAMLLLGMSVTPAGASSIGIYFDAQATICDATIAPYTLSTWYLYARLYDDAARDGMTGAALRVAGLPSGWFVTVTSNPEGTIAGSGDLFSSGSVFAFPACKPGPLVLLCTLSVFAVSPVNEVHLATLAHQPPVAPGFDCPVLTLCDSPAFSVLCVQGTAACINASASCCVLGVEPTQWSGLKSLYR